MRLIKLLRMTTPPVSSGGAPYENTYLVFSNRPIIMLIDYSGIMLLENLDRNQNIHLNKPMNVKFRLDHTVMFSKEIKEAASSYITVDF